MWIAGVRERHDAVRCEPCPSQDRGIQGHQIRVIEIYLRRQQYHQKALYHFHLRQYELQKKTIPFGTARMQKDSYAESIMTLLLSVTDAIHFFE